MMQKIEKLLIVAAEALTEARDYYATLNNSRLKLEYTAEAAGPIIPLPTPEPAPLAPVPAEKRKGGRPRKVVGAPAPEAVPDASPFSLGAPAEAGTGLAQTLDPSTTKLRCQEVMGLFIRRYLRASPSGLDRAKVILSEVCARHITRLEELTHEDKVKLIPAFEAALSVEAE